MPLDAFSNHPSLMPVYSYSGLWWILMDMNMLILDGSWLLQIFFVGFDGYSWKSDDIDMVSLYIIYFFPVTKTTSIVIVYRCYQYLLLSSYLIMLYLGGISCHINVIEPPVGNVDFDHLFNEHLKLVISPWPQWFCSPSDQWPKVQFLMCPERRRRWSTEESPLPSSVKSRLVLQRCPENRWIKATKEEAWECTSTQDIHKKEPVWRHNQIHKWKECMIKLKKCFSLLFSIFQRFCLHASRLRKSIHCHVAS